jgi:hypothetical protein
MAVSAFPTGKRQYSFGKSQDKDNSGNGLIAVGSFKSSAMLSKSTVDGLRKVCIEEIFPQNLPEMGWMPKTKTR